MPSVAAPGWRGWEWQGPALLPAADCSQGCRVPPPHRSVIWPEAPDAFRPRLTSTENVGGIAWRRENGFLEE